jgi:hypothetical protein
MVERSRQDILRDLVALSAPVRDLRAELAGFPWDSDGVLVVLSAADALDVLDRLARGEITADECAAWADALEVRDDVGLDPAVRDELGQMLFELSTPELFEPLTPVFAARWRSRLAQP